MATASDVVNYLKENSHPGQVARVAARGIPKKNVMGVPKEHFKGAVKKFGQDMKLAEALWQVPLHEARLTAVYMAEPGKMTKRQAMKWIRQIWSWDLADHFARFLMPYLKANSSLITDCCPSKELYVKRTGYAGIACAVLHKPDLTNSEIESWFELIERGGNDDR